MVLPSSQILPGQPSGIIAMSMSTDLIQKIIIHQISQSNFRYSVKPLAMADEYKPLGLTMANLTIAYGAMMIIWGIAVSVLSDSNSITSFIPSIVGAPILVCGILTNALPDQRKIWMHFAVGFGALCALGGTRFFMVISDGLNYASMSMLMLFVTGSFYTYLCIQSFKHSRKALVA